MQKNTARLKGAEIELRIGIQNNYGKRKRQTEKREEETQERQR